MDNFGCVIQHILKGTLFNRLTERLARERIFCFSTPTRTRASASKFYGWMLQGECVYQSLIQTHPLLDTVGIKHKRACFETFPHSITFAMLGTDAHRQSKRAHNAGNCLSWQE